MPTPIDPCTCPLCGKANACAMELTRSTGQPQAPCWCLAVTIAPATLARVPPQAVDRACICPACAGAGPRAA